jgi:hypothetical protein
MTTEAPVEIDHAQFAKFVKALTDWVYIKQANNQAWHRSLNIDLGHSSLIHRLLSGQPIYKFAPPTAMSYPWYELLDIGSVDRVDIHVHGYFPGYDGPVLGIDQSLWLLEAIVREGEEYIARWPKYNLRIRCVKQDYGKLMDTFNFRVMIIENENTPVAHIGEVASPPERAVKPS